jgi:predicted oxidoreductase
MVSSNFAQVRTDLASIPEKKTDQNYVDAWLQAQMAEFEKRVGTSTIKRMSESATKRLGRRS